MRVEAASSLNPLPFADAGGTTGTLLLLLLVALAGIAFALRVAGERIPAPRSWSFPGRRIGRGLCALVLVLALLVSLRTGPGAAKASPLDVIVIDLSRSQGAGIGARLALRPEEKRGEERIVVVGAGVEARLLFDGPRRELAEGLPLPADLMTPSRRRGFDPGAAAALLASRGVDRSLRLCVLTDGAFEPARAARAWGQAGLPLAEIEVRGLAEPRPADLSLRLVGEPPRFEGGGAGTTEVELLLYGQLDRDRTIEIRSSGGERLSLTLTAGPVEERLLFAIAPPAPGSRLDIELAGHRDWDRDRAVERVRLESPPAPGQWRLGIWDPRGTLVDLEAGLAAGDADVRVRRSARLEDLLAESDVLLVHDAAAPTPLDAARTKRLADFVTRGGGLALSGVEAAFGRGGWSGRPIDALSPLAARPGRRPRSITLALDRSGSMARAGRVASALAAARSLLLNLEPRDRARVWLFADEIDRGAWHEGEALAAVAGGLDGLVARGGTDLVATLEEVLATETEADRSSLILLLSDGRDPRLDDPARREDLLRRAREGGHRLFVFWFDRDAATEPFLRALTEATGGRLVPLDDFDGLTRAFFDAAAGGVRLEDVAIENRAGRSARLPVLLRTRPRPDTEILAGGGPDRAAVARKSRGAGRILALPVALDAAARRAVWGETGERGLAADLRALAPEAAVGAPGTLRRRMTAAGERLVFRPRPGLSWRPTSLDLGEGETCPLGRRGAERFESPPRALGLDPRPGGLIAVRDASGRVRGRVVLPAPDLHDLGGRPGEASREAFAAALRRLPRPPAPSDGPPVLVLALAALVFAGDLALRARGR